MRLVDQKIASWALVAGVLLVAGLGTMLLIDQLSSGRRAKVEARLETGRADAAMATASDLGATVARVAASDAAGDTLTQENRDAIFSAPGAEAPVGDALRDVSLQRLCLRAAYRGSAQCMRFTPAP